VSCAKTDELIEVPFGMWTQMGSKNPVLGGSDPSRKGAIWGHISQWNIWRAIFSTFSVGGSSDAAFNCQYCSNLLTAVTASVYNYY